MKKFLPALTLVLFTSLASPAIAQHEPYEESLSNTSSQQLVVEAINLAPRYPQLPAASNAPKAPAQPAVASGIGPSSNMAQPGDYGYSAMSDLRQLNF